MPKRARAVEVRHVQRRAPVRERHVARRAAVERDGRREVPWRILSDELRLQLHAARLVVARAHHHAAQLHGLHLHVELHAVVEAAVGVEVVEVPEELHLLVVHHGVDGGHEFVASGRKRAGAELELAPRQLAEADLASVHPEARAEAHAVHHEERVGRRLGELERAPVAARAVLVEVVRVGIPAAGHGHLVVRLERR